jgi:hypothetical protein
VVWWKGIYCIYGESHGTGLHDVESSKSRGAHSCVQETKSSSLQVLPSVYQKCTLSCGSSFGASFASSRIWFYAFAVLNLCTQQKRSAVSVLRNLYFLGAEMPWHPKRVSSLPVTIFVRLYVTHFYAMFLNMLFLLPFVFIEGAASRHRRWWMLTAIAGPLTPKFSKGLPWSHQSPFFSGMCYVRDCCISLNIRFGVVNSLPSWLQSSRRYKHRLLTDTLPEPVYAKALQDRPNL